MHKVITFGIPSYNAAKDMDHCITSILEGSNYATDIEIIVVDDGSKDETAAKADEWEARYPGIIRAVHQENGGHGIAEHWLELGGEDAIALGGDWDGAAVPALLSDASKMPEFQNMLSKRFGKTVMQKLCSDNALAFFERF